MGYVVSCSGEPAAHTVAANHNSIIKNVGLNPVQYPYYDAKNIGLDWEGFTGALESATEGSIILLHNCAHNPTGVDPSEEQWHKLAEIFIRKGHFAFMDGAYQGTWPFPSQTHADRIKALRQAHSRVTRRRSASLSMPASPCSSASRSPRTQDCTMSALEPCTLSARRLKRQRGSEVSSVCSSGARSRTLRRTVQSSSR